MDDRPQSREETWREYRNLVMAEIGRFNKWLSELDTKVGAHETQLTILEKSDAKRDEADSKKQNQIWAMWVVLLGVAAKFAIDFFSKD